MTFPDIFQPYDRLVEIEILGEKYEVPENNTLLRCFQFLALENISYGDFCWKTQGPEHLRTLRFLGTAKADKID